MKKITIMILQMCFLGSSVYSLETRKSVPFKTPTTNIKKAEVPKTDTKVTNNKPVTPAKQPSSEELFQAIEKGDVAKVKQLIADKTDVNAKDKNGDTPMIFTSGDADNSYKSRKEGAKIVKILIDAKADVNATGKYGQTALVRAANGHDFDEIVKLLIDAKADVNARNKFGDTALMAAANGDSINVVKMLIATKADVNVIGNYGGTALLLSHGGEITKLLIDAKADVNARESYAGRTVLIEAGINANVDKVKMLIAAKADVNAKNNKGTTALMQAAMAGAGSKLDNQAILVMLIAAKADVNAKDNNGKTALKLAEEAKNTEIIALLKAAGATE
jgi:ankyrin repeat protein